MSWKGFQKVMARLPQMVKQKTGFSEGTVDDEFKELNLTHVRIKQETTKFLNECISYKAAMLNLLNFQVSLMEEHQWHLTDDLNHAPSMDEYVQSLQSLRSSLSSQLEDSVDRLLIKPLTEYQLLLVKVESIIKKRNNKLLDYDRNKCSYDKMVNNPTRKNELSEEKKILKQEQALNQATIEYDRYNNLLKLELPRLLDLRSQLLKPGIQTLLAFQKLFYSKSAAIFSSVALGVLVSEGTLKSTEEKFEKEIVPVMNEIRTMGMFHGSGLKYSPNLSNASTSTLGEPANLPNPPEYTAVPSKLMSEDTKSKSLKATAASIPSILQPNRPVNTAAISISDANKSTAPIPPKLLKPSKRQVKALYDFSSEDIDDLSFKMGDLIEVLDSSDQYGWWIGKNSKGKKGNFPSNYVMEQ